ncbi:MAG: SET domain-containing protein-lysine N-methyltransferase [Cytophagaceae bacterium]|nr:SET domain-containing protein-lysine N-methyltransferase [Gemmatimonadaceae bacterium]
MSPLRKAAAAAAEQPFVIKQSKIQGRGGYATRDIRKGERLIEYVGERISWAESDRRYDDTKVKRHHTFLFTVNKRTIIDAAHDGNDARFINHSCDPNCEAIDEKNRIYIHAIKPIKKGEELVYDYGYARDKNTTEEDEKLYVCRCGSPKCRGTILEPPKKKKKAVRARHHAASRQAGTHVKPASKTKGRKKGSKAK